MNSQDPSFVDHIVSDELAEYANAITRRDTIPPDHQEPDMSSFAVTELADFSRLAERITEDVAYASRRLVVAVFDTADTGPVAWIEMHPDDSGPSIQFTDYPDWIRDAIHEQDGE